MALFNSFKFGDVDSKDYGVYISGDSVYDSPARSVDLVQVPGRNGALALDNGYYENIEVTYPAGSFGTSQEEWREKMLGIRNALAAQRGYQKLIDTYHPEHYRLGMFFAGISATPVQYNRAGQFPIRFNCKPQRFLISGDEAVEFTAEGQEEVYGPASIASFEAEEGAEIRELKVNLEPIQSGTGDPSPTNVRPISGHTEVNVYRTGKNLCEQVLQGYINRNAKPYRFIIDNNSESLVFHAKKGTTYCFSSAATFNRHQIARVREVVDRAIIEEVTTIIDDVWTATWGGLTVFYCGASKNAAIEASAQVEVGSTPTAYEPYAGQTYEVLLGENLLEIAEREIDYQGIHYALSSNGITLSGTRTTSTNGYTSLQSLWTLAKGTYTFSGDLGRTDCYLKIADSSQNVLVNGNGTFTLSADTQVRLQVQFIGAVALTTPITFKPKLISTVYGGTLNVTTGVLTVTHDIKDMGLLDWYTTASGFYANVYGSPANNQSSICSQYAFKPTANATTGSTIFSNLSDNEYAWYSNQSRVFIRDDSFNADPAAFKTAMSGVQLVYELATPTTAQLTPSQVSTLLGANNIWADNGEVEVKVVEPVALTNPTNFPAKPLIRIYGNGSVRVGDTIATVQNNADGYVDIDCESMNCYDTTGGRNADVSFSGNDFPELASGDNSILLTGPSKVEITPRWWEL